MSISASPTHTLKKRKEKENLDALRKLGVNSKMRATETYAVSER